MTDRLRQSLAVAGSGGYYTRNTVPWRVATSTGGNPTYQLEDSMVTNSEPILNPGDEAKPGTPGAAEDICEQCSGSGKLSNGAPCPNCGGSGRVMRGIGGG